MRIDAARLRRNVEDIAQFGRDEKGGWSRFVFTEEEREARDFIMGLMREAGLEVRVDAAGNIFGSREGTEPGLAPVAAGSHIDTVANGGMFDGVAGTMAAIEAVTVIHENGVRTRHPLEVIVFANEEGARFSNALWGSRAMLGIIQDEELYERKDADGMTVADAMRSFGLDPSRIGEARVEYQYYKAFVELHPEQSLILESEGISLGVVEAIAGTAWMKMKLRGRADHAGATPMHLRRDALAAAAEIVLGVEEAARNAASSTLVATVGQLEVRPGGINIVPGEVEMSFDIRDIDLESREAFYEEMKRMAGDVCGKRSMELELDEIGKVMPVPLSPEVADLIEKACMEEGVSYRRMVSGAGHDSQIMALVSQAGMIFVPSIGGVSHSPEENTGWKDMENGANVLLNVLLRLAE